MLWVAITALSFATSAWALAAPTMSAIVGFTLTQPALPFLLSVRAEEAAVPYFSDDIAGSPLDENVHVARRKGLAELIGGQT